MITHFELNDTLYAKAKIEPVESVNLWLGVSRARCGNVAMTILIT
jgi:hypothetical protein